MRIGLRDSSKGSQHCHLAVWSIEGTYLNPSPPTQHNMQKIRWAIANADVKSGKPYVCRFVDRSNKDEEGKSPTMTLNSDTKTKQESCYSGRVVMYIRLYRYKCTTIVTKPLFWKRHLARQNVYPCRSPCLATWAAHAAVKFGHEEQSTNKNKQTGPFVESENAEGLPSKLLFIPPFVKIVCMSSESSKSGSIFVCCLSNLSCTASDSTSRSDLPSESVRQWFWSLLEDNCTARTPRTALAHPMILENGPQTESCDSGIVVLSKHSSEQTQKIPELVLLNKTKKSLHALHKMLNSVSKTRTLMHPCNCSIEHCM